MWKGSTDLGMSFLNVYRRMIFSIERRTFCLAIRNSGIDY